MQKYLVTVSLLLILSLTWHLSAGKSCEEDRKEKMEKNDPQIPIPRCKENGEYNLRACTKPEDGKPKCTCYTEEGHQIKEPSSEIENCWCIVDQYEAKEAHFVGAYIPHCENNGDYQMYQCWNQAGKCWCATKDGTFIEPAEDAEDCDEHKDAYLRATREQ